MSIRLVPALLAGLLACGTAAARPPPPQFPTPQAPASPGPPPAANRGGRAPPFWGKPMAGDPQALDPRYLKQEVSYDGKEAPGTIIINTPERLLYLVEDGGRAMPYGIGVGRPGFTWAGVHTVSNKREWPDWTPPDDMLKRRPDLPRHMEGGPENPLAPPAMSL